MSQFRKNFKADLNDIISTYKKEYAFITELLKNEDFNHQKTIGDDEPTESVKTQGKSPSNREKIETSTRAKSLEELHQRLEALKEAKYSYKGGLMKRRLKKELKKKKKVFEKKKKIESNRERKSGENASPKMRDVKPVVKSEVSTFNEDSKLVFNKFDFMGEKCTELSKDSLKTERNKDLALKNLIENEKRFKEMVESGQVEEAAEYKGKASWKNVLQKAEGLKVKDDKELLKKSIYKRDSLKKRSKKKWENRLHSVETKKQERQNKRMENLEKRKDQKKKTSKKKAIKKGRFLN